MVPPSPAIGEELYNLSKRMYRLIGHVYCMHAMEFLPPPDSLKPSTSGIRLQIFKRNKTTRADPRSSTCLRDGTEALVL